MLLLAIYGASVAFWLSGAAFLLAAFTFRSFFYHYIYDVQFGATAFELVVFKSFVVFAIPYEDVTRIERATIGNRVFSFAFPLVNRPFGQAFIIYRNRGIFRRILVTPGDPEAFWNKLTPATTSGVD